jgi:predicted dehydrogenase
MFDRKKVRFAVVGLGHIAQVAVLPAFEHSSEKCELVALVSGDEEKLSQLSTKYAVPRVFRYDQYDNALASGEFDAVYIALPNDMHHDFAIRAAAAGIHVLCEKPMALNSIQCQEMIQTAEANFVKLMVAYRLHFEKTNMKAVEAIIAGKIGEPKLFNSTFTMQVREGNIRTQKEHGGGPLYDVGIYCINAARYLFRNEPEEVTAIMAQSRDLRFLEIEESIGALMKFPGERIASFVASFGSKDVSRYEVVGSDGRIVLEPAYDYVEELEYKVVSGEHQEQHKTPKRDQFAPELLHFAECIMKNEQPCPSGYEGLADIRVIEALQESAMTGKTVKVVRTMEASKPDNRLVQEKPPVKKPKLVKAESGSK